MLTEQELFFYSQAGYSYTQTETPDEGRARGARSLAAAETWAREEGVTFEWSDDPDGYMSAGEGDEGPWYQLLAQHPDGRTASLGGVSLNPSEDTWWGSRRINPYARVVEAELASEIREQTPSTSVTFTEVELVMVRDALDVLDPEDEPTRHGAVSKVNSALARLHA